jgi:hypothetical protein
LTAVPTVEPSYRLLLVANDEDSLFVVNQSADPFPLEGLLLGGERGAIEGAEWEVAFLEPESCVTVWRNVENSEPPDVECEQVGERIERRGQDRFWRNEYSVFYEGEEVAMCEGNGRCVVEIIP